jgi:hypothetical protein
MKLRLKGNSIRLRLTQGEVARLAETGAVEERVEFGNSGRTFVYAVEATGDGKEVAAEFVADRIRVVIPAAAAREWAQSDEVGLYATPDGLSISVEKDFACVKPRAGEDESDMFPHPDPGAC